MKLPSSLIVILLTLTIGGCSLFETNEGRFLSHAQERATQEEIQQRLGPPALMKTAPSGQPVWVYQIYDWQPGSRVTAPGTRCDEYRLTFDDQRILRRGWTHKTYFHGGEAFPSYCVPERFYSPVE